MTLTLSALCMTYNIFCHIYMCFTYLSQPANIAITPYARIIVWSRYPVFRSGKLTHVSSPFSVMEKYQFVCIAVSVDLCLLLTCFLRCWAVVSRNVRISFVCWPSGAFASLLIPERLVGNRSRGFNYSSRHEPQLPIHLWRRKALNGWKNSFPFFVRYFRDTSILEVALMLCCCSAEA